tara:strand:+ start:308 stop:562 length:255 start_codon:yes stop_codon:yes gene_type:complete
MKDKNLPNNIHTKSLRELKEMASNIIENLEKEQDLNNSINEYQNLIKLNNLIEKKFQTKSKEISITSKEKISKLIKKKNEKKTK